MFTPAENFKTIGIDTNIEASIHILVKGNLFTKKSSLCLNAKRTGA